MPKLGGPPNSPDFDLRVAGGTGQERRDLMPQRLAERQRPVTAGPQMAGAGPRSARPARPEVTPLAPAAPPTQRALQDAAPLAAEGGAADVRIVGVGGGGSNAVNRMIEAGIGGVEFIACNTDPQALEQSQAPHKIHLGREVARRLGAGGDPNVGRHAAEDSIDTIEDAVAGADMIFITAGMGGGTGTGAAPIIAHLARQLNALTVGVVTLPFMFEGARRRRLAEEGIAELRKAVDALIVIPNDRLLGIAERHTSMVQAFRRADDMLRHGVQGIADLVTVAGLINLDFADVRAVMQDAGPALMAIGESSGDGRALRAAQMVVGSPLLEHSIEGARGILLNVTGGPDLSLYEMNDVAAYITQHAAPDANIIVGAVINPQPEVELRVTLIATGMPESPQPPEPGRRPGQAAAFGRQVADAVSRSVERAIEPGAGHQEPSQAAARTPRVDAEAAERQPERPAAPSTRDLMPLPDDADPLDVPSYLRRSR